MDRRKSVLRLLGVTKRGTGDLRQVCEVRKPGTLQPSRSTTAPSDNSVKGFALETGSGSLSSLPYIQDPVGFPIGKDRPVTRNQESKERACPLTLGFGEGRTFAR